MSTPIVLFVCIYGDLIEEIKPYIGVNAFERAASAFEAWTGISYAEYKKRSDEGEESEEILGEDKAGSTIMFETAEADSSLQQPEKETMLVLSTSHITEEIYNALLQGQFETFSYYPKEAGFDINGFFIYVPHKDENLKSFDLPDCLESIFRYAQSHDSEWILLERDAELSPNLPVYV
ncbi:hypothetical protein [Paenibacillus glucanolyticus]|uniref:DUF5983 family protein n=1 Tax=Paenibacillus glucanolyticus TaxID=59843 RepID=UPI00096EC075|nr:hypothetical protein [Paenibacillus glucanolyticus]OMF66849.1 hypothetical protein BK142_29085 [Paenibacillus glucanolyticus]